MLEKVDNWVANLVKVASSRFLRDLLQISSLGTPSLSLIFFLEFLIMGNKLYVGNLAYSMRDADLEQAFSEYGAVSSARVMMDRDSGRSKGFGFVEMSNDSQAQAAITALNGRDMGGRNLVVNEARPREDRPAGGGARRGAFGGGNSNSRKW